MNTTTKPATHTPGPWTDWNRESTVNGYAARVIGSEHHAVASVHIGDTTTEPNLRLICAAPDLLAAVECALDILERLAPPIQLGTLCEEQDHATAIRAARAAIAQAKRQP
jgi:hypothetical protein